ncbi:MAG: polysaccharide export protein [Acidocella sp.]|nr:polysaccharide export protein [Acidocella sp.]
MMRSNLNKSDFFPARIKKACGAAVLVSSIMLSACSQGGDLPIMPQPQDSAYRLGPGDQIRVITYDETQLSNDFTVGQSGSVAFPLIGVVKATGLTPDQFATSIENALKAQNYISQPSVSVQVIDYRPISVLGEVNKPGQYPYEPGMTMLDAVALAGGFTYRAVTGYAGDWRGGVTVDGKPVEGKIAPNTDLEPGDVVTIYEKYF